MQIGDLHFEHKVDGLMVGLFVITLLAVISAVVRLFTRVVLIREPGIDDAFISSAIFGSVAYLASSLHLVGYALKLNSDLSYWPKIHQSLYATIISYTVTHFSFKFSILFLSKRIFIDKKAQRTFRGLIIYLAIWGIICMSLSIATCVPVPKYWNDAIPGRCVDRMALHYAFSGINIVNDVAILVAPLLFIKSLQMSTKTKFGLAGLFACGGIACIFAMVRVQALYEKGTAPPKEQPYRAAITSFWSGLEVNIAIICACVPALRGFIRRFKFPPGKSTLDSSKTKSSRRYAGGSVRLHGHEDRTDAEIETRSTNTKTNNGGIEIRVRQSFEMKSVDVVGSNDDSSSQQDLVPSRNPHWRAHVYSGASESMAKQKSQD